jgi:hypothetical protein
MHSGTPVEAWGHTAVQLRSATEPHCELVHGDPQTLLAGQLGPVALFPPGEIVAYVIHARRPSRLYLFRTLHTLADPDQTTVPGVRPRVRLLLALDSQRLIRRCRRFFALLGRRQQPATDLTDGFYLRLERALRARAPLPRLLAALLEAHTPC